MGTRSGSIDPAVIEFIADKENLSIKEVLTILNKESGVLGISGLSSDFRDLEEAMAQGHARAKLALSIFNYRVRKYIGEYAAAMGGLDAVIFTGGVGENNQILRQEIANELSFMGFSMDPMKNQIRGQEIDLSNPDAKIKMLVIPTNEELAIARLAKSLLS
jgi:acetate kinase